MIIDSDLKVTYRGDGQTTVFPFSFPFISKEYICVKILDETTGIATKLESDYFVDETAKTVIYPGYPPGQEPAESNIPPKLPETSTLTIYRDTEINQLTALGPKFPLPDIEQALDKLTEILQEHDEDLERCVKVDITSVKKAQEYLDEILQKAAESKESATQAAQSEQAAAESAESASASAESAGDSAEEAADSLREAKELIGVIGVAGEPYDATKTYHLPDIVITPDGTSWRCLQTSTGEYPATSSKWVAVALAQGETFEYDDDGNLMPLEYAQTSSMWQVVDGDIMPAEVVRL